MKGVQYGTHHLYTYYTSLGGTAQYSMYACTIVYIVLFNTATRILLKTNEASCFPCVMPLKTEYPFGSRDMMDVKSAIACNMSCEIHVSSLLTWTRFLLALQNK